MLTIFLSTDSPPWVIGLFTVILVALIYLIKMIISFLFNSSSKDDTTEKERLIFSKKLDVRKKDGWIERIDYWIEQENYWEAKDLLDIYQIYNTYIDEEFHVRLKLVNEKLNYSND